MEIHKLKKQWKEANNYQQKAKNRLNLYKAKSKKALVEIKNLKAQIRK